uniref:PH domain-containing protein n=1 Tax=Astatotilapia calliptera TaxID=8154 RepID=A0AAX7VM44_ASTCA
MQRYSHYIAPMDPQVCPPPLSSSQSVISGLDKSPASTFRPGHSRSSSTGSGKHSKQSRHWEVVDDLQHADRGLVPGSSGDLSIPGICEGYLMKRRKYPLKGWHKRYFLLEKGILKYSKTQQDIQRGKLHGSLDISMAVMSVNKKTKRIDLDAGDNLYHLKAKSHDIFYIWLTKLCAHRVFRKNEAMSVHRGVLHALSLGQSTLPAFSQQSRATVSITSCSSKLSTAERKFTLCYRNPIKWRIADRLVNIFATKKCLSINNLDDNTLDNLFIGLKWSNYSWNHVSSLQRTPSLSRHSNRPPSVADSMAEYFDASEVIVCETSSEAEASDESGLSDITTTSTSEPEEGHCEYLLSNKSPLHDFLCHNKGRRTTLPAPCADNSHIGIMTILYNNIGKDLSRVSMPVALNEPLSLLQRLSEELEYSELLDIASNIDDPYERMVYVAAFSISGYAWASWRNRYKPFNPVLGETYENYREDKGFQYISEQSQKTSLSDQRWKYKFWGKSVEIISSGLVNVTLPSYGDHYEWNKAVTCIHNVLSQQRSLEHYGEVTIRNTKSDVCTCKITFVKSRYWSSDSSKNEVQGVVLDQAGSVIHRFGGLWHEGIFCDTLPTPKCIWKPNVQPDDYVKFYGFSSYARELNELTSELKAVLPPTDTRFRPDQRLLEEGKIAEADKRKDEVEENQRERRKEMAKKGEEHIPRFFRKSVDEAGREVWLYNGTYWMLRKDPGFANTENLDLW